MTSFDNTQQTSPQVSLEKAVNAAKYGRKTEALSLLRTVVAQQPVNQAAWLWLSAIAPDKSEAVAAFKQAKKINPDHPSLRKAEQWLVHRFSTDAPTRKTTPADTKPSAAPKQENHPPKAGYNGWRLLNIAALGIAIIAIVIGMLVLFFGLFLEFKATAVAGDTAVVFDTPATNQPPLVKGSGQEMEPGKRTETVQNQQASIVNKSEAVEPAGFGVDHASPEEAEQLLRLAAIFLSGSRHYQAGEWQLAIAELEKVRQENSDYPNVKDMLYSAYYNHGLAQHAANEPLKAKEAFETAILLRPDLELPHHRLAEIEAATTAALLTDTTSISIENRIIVVGIAEQRMEVYDGDKLVYEFVVSTGEPGRDTAVGEFEILNKIDVAYASTWNLDMPFWMGIYWAGPLQNGIHSLPIVKHTGYKLWDGYLGQRVSYGCVILSDEDAATLYDWTEIGTKVKIVPSLAYWSLDDSIGGS